MLVGWGMHNVLICLFHLVGYEIDCFCYVAIMMITIVVIILKLHAFSISWLCCQINISAVLPSKSVCTTYVRQGLCDTYQRLFDRPAVKTEIGCIPRRIWNFDPPPHSNLLYFRVDITRIISVNWCRSHVVPKYSLKISTWIQRFFFLVKYLYYVYYHV